MNPKYSGAVIRGQAHHARGAQLSSLGRRPTQYMPQERLPGRSDQQRKPQRGQFRQPVEDHQIMIERFAEADAGVQDDLVFRHPGLHGATAASCKKPPTSPTTSS